MNLDLQGKGVLITGGAGGIGQTIITAFAKEDARVHFTYHSNRDGADELRKRCRAEPPIRMDLSNPTSVESAFRSAEAVGPIDVLVNNAVLWRPSPDDEDAAGTMFQANIDGPYRLTRLALACHV